MLEGVAGPAARELAAEVVARLTQAGHTLATAESLTGGLVAAAVTDVPGASSAFRGGVVAYATELKAEALGVDVAMLKAHGPGYAPVAAAMAQGVRKRLQATIGVATTGVAGPDPQNGYPPVPCTSRSAWPTTRWFARSHWLETGMRYVD